MEVLNRTSESECQKLANDIVLVFVSKADGKGKGKSLGQ